MGGISAQTGKRQGEVGAIVQGGVRDIAHSRAIDYPVWASEITPVTGKWRLETVEINGPIQMGEVRVNPGDLVVADDTGVCSFRATWCWKCSRAREKGEGRNDPVQGDRRRHSGARYFARDLWGEGQVTCAARRRRVRRDLLAFRTSRLSREAEGILPADGLGVSDSYLHWPGIEATLQLSQSTNAKVVIIGSVKDGLPVKR